VLVRDDIVAFFETQAGFAGAGDRVGVVVLETTLDEELLELGFLRELLNRVQTARKDLGLEYTDRIRLTLGASDRVKRIVSAHKDALARDVLAVDVSFGAAPGGREVDVEGEKVVIGIERA
jgi:isoleucyl-tRNA synthetase